MTIAQFQNKIENRNKILLDEIGINRKREINKFMSHAHCLIAVFFCGFVLFIVLFTNIPMCFVFVMVFVFVCSFLCAAFSNPNMESRFFGRYLGYLYDRDYHRGDYDWEVKYPLSVRVLIKKKEKKL